MSQSNLTRWIEYAEARTYTDAAKFELSCNPTERHYLHLGETIAKVPSRLRHGVSLDSLAAIGCHALAYIRHPLSRNPR